MKEGPDAKETPMPSITPSLWFDHNLEEAANFYVTLFPDSRVDNIVRSPADTPSGPEGYVMVIPRPNS